MTRIALFQSNTGIDPAANAAALVKAIGEAAGGGAAMLFTPEMSGLLDRDSHRASANLRTEEEDMVLAACREAAREHGIWVHLGSLAVLVEDGKVANRGLLIDRTGKIQARYDKIHLFDVDLPTGESWRESAVYRAGEKAVVVNGTPVGKLGLTICSWWRPRRSAIMRTAATPSATRWSSTRGARCCSTWVRSRALVLPRSR
jgi:predicted amidohydrolase